MNTMNRAQQIAERLEVVVCAAVASCFAFVGGTMTELWGVFVTLAVLFFLLSLVMPEIVLSGSVNDGMAGLYGGMVIFGLIGGLTYAFWQNEHPIRAAQTYAITGTVCLVLSVMSINGYFLRRENDKKLRERAQSLRPSAQP